MHEPRSLTRALAGISTWRTRRMWFRFAAAIAFLAPFDCVGLTGKMTGGGLRSVAWASAITLDSTSVIALPPPWYLCTRAV